MNAEDITVIEQSALAHNKYDDLVAAKFNVTANTIVIAKLLSEIHDNAYWKLLGHDSWESFLGMPEIGFSRSWAYALMGLYRFYCGEMNVPADRLLKAGTTNLMRLMRGKTIELVKGDCDEWIAKAESLSKSDLEISISEAEGEVHSPPPSPPRPPSPEPSPDTCVNGCSGPAEKGHMPITRGAGGKEVEDWWIPMCRDCHRIYHQDPKEWVWTYRKNWGRYLYGHLNRGE